MEQVDRVLDFVGDPRFSNKPGFSCKDPPGGGWRNAQVLALMAGVASPVQSEYLFQKLVMRLIKKFRGQVTTYTGHADQGEEWEVLKECQVTLPWI